MENRLEPESDEGQQMLELEEAGVEQAPAMELRPVAHSTGKARDSSYRNTLV